MNKSGVRTHLAYFPIHFGRLAPPYLRVHLRKSAGLVSPAPVDVLVDHKAYERAEVPEFRRTFCPGPPGMGAG